MDDKPKQSGHSVNARIQQHKAKQWISIVVVGTLFVTVATIVYQRLSLQPTSPAAVRQNAIVGLRDHGLESQGFSEVAEYSDSLASAVCAETRSARPSVVLARIEAGQPLLTRLMDGGVALDDVESTLERFHGLCAAIRTATAVADVVDRFGVRLDDITRRVARIAEEGCGPRFDINWSYHVDRIRAGNEPEMFDRVAEQIERALSYYEDLARNTCAMGQRMREELGKLSERLDYDRRVDTLSKGLQAVRGIRWPGAEEVCRVLTSDNFAIAGRIGLYNNRYVSGCPRTFRLLTSEGWKEIGASRYRDGTEVSLTFVDGNFVVDSFRPSRRQRGWEEVAIQGIINAVCVDRLTKSRALGRRLFTEALPGWGQMSSLRREHYREIFDAMVESGGDESRDGDLGLDAEGRCADPDYRTLASLVDGIVDRKYEGDVAVVEQRFARDFAQEYGLQSYVGRRLQGEIYLQRMYELEYELRPDGVAESSGFGYLADVIRELSEEYQSQILENATRAHEWATAELNARTQIENARIQAEVQFAVAKEQAQAQRDVARIRQETEMARLRVEAAQRRDFWGQVLTAAAPALGSGVVRGVLEEVVFQESGDARRREVRRGGTE